MPETLLRTKLFVPPLRPDLVRRPQLIDRLNQGLQLGHKLTLVSAPPGFGKTTLVSKWVVKSGRRRHINLNEFLPGGTRNKSGWPAGSCPNGSEPYTDLPYAK